MKKFKVLHIITGLGLGGAEKIVCDFSEKLIDNNHEVKLIYLYGNIDIQIDPRIAITKIDIKNPFLAVLRTLKLIKYYQPDIIHSHMYHANIFSRIIKLFKPNIRLINTAHSSNEGGKFRMFIYRMTNFLSDIFTNVSEGAILSFENKKAVPKGYMLSVPNGINTSKFIHSSIKRNVIRKKEGVREDEYLILSIGSLRDVKDYYCAINVAKTLVNDFDLKFKWLILGKGPLEEQLKTKVVEAKLQDVIRFIGVRENTSDYYSAADVFVSTSKWEGFGLVIAEAMSSELNVISTSTSGAIELLYDKNWLSPVNDYTSLAKLIYKSSKLKDKSINILNRNKIVKDYSIDAYYNKWIDIYINLVDK
ncbi:TPA: glycosyltransferase [Photobacterium damselae]